MYQLINFLRRCLLNTRGVHHGSNCIVLLFKPNLHLIGRWSDWNWIEWFILCIGWRTSRSCYYQNFHLFVFLHLQQIPLDNSWTCNSHAMTENLPPKFGWATHGQHAVIHVVEEEMIMWWWALPLRMLWRGSPHHVVANCELANKACSCRPYVVHWCYHWAYGGESSKIHKKVFFSVCYYKCLWLFTSHYKSWTVIGPTNRFFFVNILFHPYSVFFFVQFRSPHVRH